MITILLVFLVFVDLIMLGIIFFLGKKRVNPIEVLKEISQEKRELKEIAQSIRDDLKQKQSEFKDLYKKINGIAAEAEVELRSYSETLNGEMTKVLDEFGTRLSNAASDAMEHRSAVSSLLQRSDKERKALQRIVVRAEKLSKFFNHKVPYEQVLEEIEDKKYVDARHLLAQGMSQEDVASEVGLPQSEVSLIAALG